jgi:hypothetical protein
MTFGLGTINRNGFQLGPNDTLTIDGPICLILGVVTVVIGITRLVGSEMPALLQRSSIVTGIAAGILIALNWSGVHSIVVRVQNAGAAAAIGYGYWICAIGAAVAIVAGLVLRSADKG